MNTDKRRFEDLDAVTDRVIAAAFEISNVLGTGFLEKVYERALARELALRGLNAETQVAYSVLFKGKLVGEYIADLVVCQKVLVELRCVDRFAPEHTAQCLNYLKASGLPVALLFNFHKPRVEWKRVISG